MSAHLVPKQVLMLTGAIKFSINCIIVIIFSLIYQICIKKKAHTFSLLEVTLAKKIVFKGFKYCFGFNHICFKT